MENSQIELVIKNPSSINDFKLKINLQNTTILQLKQTLSEQYPTKPNPEQQKLIFAGRLLKNESLISEVLSQYDTTTTQTFHLVVSKLQNISSPSPNTFINQNFPNQPQFPVNFPQVNGFPQQFVGFNPQPRQVPPPQQHQNNFVNGDNNQQNERDRDRNANGGPLYLLVKLTVLVYILSSGGSNLRTGIIAIGAVLVFLYQTGRFRIVAQIHRNEAPQPQQQPIIPPPQNQNDENNQNQIPIIPTATNPVSQNRGIVGEISGLVVPFFYSLFPTWTPASANANPPNPNPNPNAFAPMPVN